MYSPRFPYLSAADNLFELGLNLIQGGVELLPVYRINGILKSGFHFVLYQRHFGYSVLQGQSVSRRRVRQLSADIRQ